jgi:hypothetical protein
MKFLAINFLIKVEIMKVLSIVLMFLFLMSYSCKVKEYEQGNNAVVNALKADKASYEVDKESLNLKFEFKKAYNLELEYLASIALVTFYDQSIEKLNKEGVKFINITIKLPTDEKIFQYAVGQVPYYKTAVNTSALFIENFLKSNMEANLQYVNTDILPKEKLLELNQIAATVMATNKIEDYAFDGFKLEPKENLLHAKAILNADKELLRVTIQVQLTTSKISYFGINDDL